MIASGRRRLIDSKSLLSALSCFHPVRMDFETVLTLSVVTELHTDEEERYLAGRLTVDAMLPP